MMLSSNFISDADDSRKDGDLVGLDAVCVRPRIPGSYASAVRLTTVFGERTKQNFFCLF